MNILEIENKKMKFEKALWLLLGLGFFACYNPTLLWLNYKYSTPESYYSHGYLIPFVFLYLLYDKRSDLKKIHTSGNISGLFIILFALVVHFLGVLSDVSFISGFSIIMYLFGCSLYLFGAAITRSISFPLGFLVFMMPIPDEYLGVVALPIKSAATWVALEFMDIINVPYIRDGFSIILANGTFIVGTPCNGLRSLISFLALGVLFAYFIRMSLIKSAILFMMIPLMAIVLNGARIAILLLISIFFGQKAAAPESFLHDASGFFVFIVGLGIMIAGVKMLYDKKTS